MSQTNIKDNLDIKKYEDIENKTTKILTQVLKMYLHC